MARKDMKGKPTNKLVSNAEIKRPAHRVNWASLRRVRWREIFDHLKAYKIDKQLPDNLPPRVRRRVLLLGDIVHLDRASGMMTIDTMTPHHEDIDKDGEPMLRQEAATRYRIVSPIEVPAVIEATYKNPGLGATRGVSTIYKLLSRSYLGISRKDVEQTLLRIAVYRSRLKPNAREIQPQLSDEPYPMSHVKIDLMDMGSVSGTKGNKGYNWLLNVVDMHSRFAWSIPIKTKHASIVAFELEKLFLVELRPSIASFSTIGSDQGGEFKADVIRLVAEFGLKFSRGSPYSSSTQGLVEAFNKTIRNMLARQTDESGTKAWLPFLDKTVGAYNRQKHSAHGMAPIEVMRGRKHVSALDAEVRRRLIKNAERMRRDAERFNAKRGTAQAVVDSASDINVGDFVRLAFQFMKAVKKRGRIAQKALMGREGTRGRQWTQEVYKVVKVKKRFGDAKVDAPRERWKYFVVDDEQMYRREALQKAADSTIKRANMATALTELYLPKGAATDRGSDRMPRAVKKYTEMSDAEIRKQYKREAEAEAFQGPRTRQAKADDQVTTRSRAGKTTDTAKADKRAPKKQTIAGKKTDAAKLKIMKNKYIAVKIGSRFKHIGKKNGDGDGLMYTVISIDYTGRGSVVAKSKTTEYNFKLSYVQKMIS
jgi:hypothetical protein